MYCPVCENEYEPGIGQCPSCGSQLVANLHGGIEDSIAEPVGYEEPVPDEETEVQDPISPAEFSELVQIFAASGYETELIRSLLEGSGIEVMVRRSGLEGAYGSSHDTLLMVRQRDVAQAREVIRAAQSGELEIADDE